MPIYKITITYVPAKNIASPQWFTAQLDSSASWALPKDQSLSIKGTANNAPASLNVIMTAGQVVVESPLDSNEVQLYVETDEAKLAVHAEYSQTPGITTLSFKSDVDTHDCVEQSIGADNFSLRLA
jgi:hypothetical protein